MNYILTKINNCLKSVMGKRRSNKLSNRDRVRMHRSRKKIEKKDSELVNLHIQSLMNIGTNSPVPEPSEQPTLRIGLQKWASEYRIGKRAIDRLLGILNSSGVKSLPKNHRTLQKTPINVPISEIAGGQLWYNGLEKCLHDIFLKLDKNISIRLNFNIDGLPSTRVQRCLSVQY